MKNYKRIIASVLAVLTLTAASCLTLTGCGCSGEGSVVSTTAPLTEEVIKAVTIDTPYGDLEIEEEDEKDIIVEKVEGDDVYTVKFSTKIGGKKVLLFDTQFGEGSGDYVGTVKKDGEKCDVYLNFYDIESDKFTEDQLNKIYALQENINVVNESIKANPTFEE